MIILGTTATSAERHDLTGRFAKPAALLCGMEDAVAPYPLVCQSANLVTLVSLCMQVLTSQL
jgi:hypothetical protein